MKLRKGPYCLTSCVLLSSTGDKWTNRVNTKSLLILPVWFIHTTLINLLEIPYLKDVLIVVLKISRMTTQSGKKSSWSFPNFVTRKSCHVQANFMPWARILLLIHAHEEWMFMLLIPKQWLVCMKSRHDFMRMRTGFMHMKFKIDAFVYAKFMYVHAHEHAWTSHEQTWTMHEVNMIVGIKSMSYEPKFPNCNGVARENLLCFEYEYGMNMPKNHELLLSYRLYERTKIVFRPPTWSWSTSDLCSHGTRIGKA